VVIIAWYEAGKSSAVPIDPSSAFYMHKATVLVDNVPRLCSATGTFGLIQHQMFDRYRNNG
jgi:hypothetical protein